METGIMKTIQDLIQKELYAAAMNYAAEAELQAQAQVGGMDIETLRRDYVSMMGMVAYYTKIERVMTKPRLHMDAIKSLLVKMKADELLDQAALAEEQGMPISGTARVPAKPLIELLSQLKQMTTV
jgi:hypothetical protein